MSMDVYLDIETVPCADRQSYIEDAKQNFRAPSSLTKGQAGEDLGITGDKLKYTSADDIKKQWEQEMASVKAEEVGDEAWRKTALDGTHGRVLCIGWKVPGMERNTQSDYPGEGINEAQTILRAFAGIQTDLQQVNGSTNMRSPFFIGHNIVFDLKFLFRRCVILGIKPPFDLPFWGRNGKDYYCTMKSWCEYGERISQSNLLAALGVDEPGDMDGSMVCDAWLNGELERIGEYCAQDVGKVEAIHKRMTFQEN